MNKSAVLFDLDGTLLDTLEDLGASVDRVLARLGFPTHPITSYKLFVGEGISVLATRALPPDRRDAASVKTCEEAISADYIKHYMDATGPYEGIVPLLEGLAKRDFKLAVLSNKPHAMVRQLVAHFFPRTEFQCVSGARDGVPKKPHPFGALDIARHIKIGPADFLYLGDTGVDMETAASAGMFPVGALWGFRDAQELLDNGAKALIKNPLELLKIADGE
jgi:haloacid dehalogenase superfamily, subfamily IA, variant 1 with third motif having Dx(3-4)D or Dx(3-4)E